MIIPERFTVSLYLSERLQARRALASPHPPQMVQRFPNSTLTTIQQRADKHMSNIHATLTIWRRKSLLHSPIGREMVFQKIEAEPEAEPSQRKPEELMS